MPAIRMAPGASVGFKDVSFSGFDVGIQADGPVNIQAENVTFDNVRQPFDIAAGRADISGTRIRNDPKTGTGNKSKVGWTRPYGPPLPAFCPNCKSVFPSKNYNFGSSHFFSRDNEEVCPVCSFEHAKLSDGLFDLSRDVVRILSAPDMTHAMLATIRGIADLAVAEKITPAAAVSQFTAVNPKFGAIARRALKLGVAAVFFVAAVASIAQIYFSNRQIQLAQEQITIAKDQRLGDQATDDLLAQILDRLSDVVFVLGEQKQPSQGNAEAAATGKPDSKATPESHAVKSKSKGPPTLPKKKRGGRRTHDE